MISILLPIFNERENLKHLLEELRQVLSGLGQPFEIIAVDDASTDGSARELEELAADRPYLKVLVFRANCGQTAALDAGFRHASGDIIVTLDADRQNDPRDIPLLLNKLNEGYDCVMGWRERRQDGFWLRRLPSRIANALIRRLWKTQIKDLGCALKVYRQEVTRDLQLYGEMHRFIGLLLEGAGARVVSLPVNHRPRVAGYSKYNLTRVFKVTLDLITIWFLQRFRTKPIYVFGGAGAVSIALGAVFSGVALWQKLSTDFSLNRNPLFTLSVFQAMIGLQFIALGLLGEVLIRNYFESTGRTPYSIRHRLGFDEPVRHKRAL